MGKTCKYNEISLYDNIINQSTLSQSKVRLTWVILTNQSSPLEEGEAERYRPADLEERGSLVLTFYKLLIGKARDSR